MSNEPSYGGAVVLVTGGTGSFGNTVSRHLLGHGVKQVRIFSRDESKQHDMRTAFDDPRLSFHVGDVRDVRSIERAVDGVDFVFHAAALKQVPSCEFFPGEAVLTNVLGSQNVIDASQRMGVRSVVCLSTDKAVMPVNAMGMSKGLMEKVAAAAARGSSSTVVSTVRYGNVLYSRGSVVPLFVQKILAGEPLPITNPEMTRFLMPLSQAVDLVDFAFRHAQPGDIFVRKAPAATVADLAAAVNELFGNPVTTKVIGTRHGEKLYEVLATTDELLGADDLGEYWRIPMDGRDLNYSEYFDVGRDVSQRDEFNSHNAQRLDVAGVRDLLLSLPEIQANLAKWQQHQHAAG